MISTIRRRDRGFEQWGMITNFGDPSGRKHVGGRRRHTHTADKVLTLYHPPSQKSTVYGRWKKTSLTVKLLGRATLILRYYVIRVLRNAVAASNHVVGIECFVETTSASVFFLVFFLALHTNRVKERTVMVMS